MFSIFLFVFILLLSDNGVYAFGAGNIPSFAYMEGQAFRHGDIEDALAELLKRGAATGGMAVLTSLISKGSKFNGLDIKRVYFGNWLRDYSQAMDIAALKKMPQQTILNLCMVLGFLAHGYATQEFEVTPDRLGVYLPAEHIDNPKGYGEGEDARKYHPKLRPPINPQELEIDHRTGMKNYIANEQGGWDTSKALVRRTLEQCIRLGRQHRAQGQKQDEYEAYRLLGTAMHTLEDFPAHSNWCELVLVSMGHQDVFLHVGDQVRVQAPNGRWTAPIVTGTFGSSDFLHSLLGEATDHLSEASVSDLNRELNRARSVSQTQSRSGGGVASAPGDILRDLFFSIPGGSGAGMSRDLDAIERIRAGPAAGGKSPDQMSPQEVHSVLWQVLSFRDSVMKTIEMTIEKIPGLNALVEKITDSIAVFILTTLEPFLKPLLKTATMGLQEASGEVINNHDQYEVFNDPRASDPTHSFLSKDHFNLILNEPAGQVARVIVTNTVNLVTKAWDDPSVNVHQTTEEILQSLFHPEFHNPSSKVQREMLQCMKSWIQSLGQKQSQILHRLTKNCVRNHENVRGRGDGGPPAAQGSYAQQQGSQMQGSLMGLVNQVPGAGVMSSLLNSGGTKKDGGMIAAGAGMGVKTQTQTTQTYMPHGGSGGGGESVSFYNTTTSVQTSSYGPPQGAPPPPPQHTPHSHAPTSYMPPTGPPPSFPGTASPHTPHAPHNEGYAPSYAPVYYSSPPPRQHSPPIGMPGTYGHFPGDMGGRGTPPLSFPGAHAHGGGGYGPPPGPPPGFPGGNVDHQHHQHQHHQQPPQFPGSYEGGRGW